MDCKIHLGSSENNFGFFRKIEDEGGSVGYFNRVPNNSEDSCFVFADNELKFHDGCQDLYHKSYIAKRVYSENIEDEKILSIKLRTLKVPTLIIL